MPTLEVARQIVVPDSDELADRVFVDLGAVGNQDDRCVKRRDPADPGRERRPKLHVVDARDVATGVVVDGAHVHHRFSASLVRVYLMGCQWRKPRQFPEDAWTATIHCAHVVKIGWVTWHTCEQAISKRLRIRQRQQRIAAAFATDRGRRFRGRGRRTERAGAVRRIDHDVVTQRQDSVMQGVIQLMGQTRRVLMAQQVSP